MPEKPRLCPHCGGPSESVQVGTVTHAHCLDVYCNGYDLVCLEEWDNRPVEDILLEALRKIYRLALDARQSDIYHIANDALAKTGSHL